MKKLFGKLDISWKNLIIFAIIIAIYTALMAIIPITKDTSFRDIAIDFGWWIFFGVIIIVNSKSAIDAALKCFIFFLISQPLVYLFQVPFSDKGFGLFEYYKYWFLWTLLTIPMGYIGHNIKKNNIISLIILLPMLCILSAEVVEYGNLAINNFPSHILSFITSLSFIFIISINILKKTSLRIFVLIIVFLFGIGYYIQEADEKSATFTIHASLEDYNIKLDHDSQILNYTDSDLGKVSIIKFDKSYVINLSGMVGKKYSFTLLDDNIEYEFEYYYINEEGLVIYEKRRIAI